MNDIFQKQRRLYIGNVPETINQEYLSEWLYRSLEAGGGLQASLPSENPIVKCEIDPKGRFAFTEMRSIEETAALLQLDGIILWHRQLRIRRPTEYEKFPLVQGQFEVPKLNFDLFKTVGIVIIPTVVDDGPNKVFLANLPTKMDELMILDELKLREMGEIKAFHLVKDNQTNQSKGFAFFEFKDPSVTDGCIEALHGLSYAGRTLTCKRSQVGGAGNKQNTNSSRQQNKNRQQEINQQSSGMNNNHIYGQTYQGEEAMDQNQSMGQQGMNEGTQFFPNYQQNNQGQSHQQNNKGMNQNYQNKQRRNFGNQNNGMNMNQGGNSGNQNKRFQNNNMNNNNQQFNNNYGGNKFNKGHMNNNSNFSKGGKQNQWGGNAMNNDQQNVGQYNSNNFGGDEYYDDGNYDYDNNQASYQYQNNAPNYMQNNQQNHYQ